MLIIKITVYLFLKLKTCDIGLNPTKKTGCNFNYSNLNLLKGKGHE